MNIENELFEELTIPMLFYCCVSGEDGGPTFKQHWYLPQHFSSTCHQYLVLKAHIYGPSKAKFKGETLFPHTLFCPNQIISAL